MRHDDLFFFLHAFGGLTRFADLACTPHQFFNDALDHLHHIGFALTQIRIIDGIELLHQIIHLLHQCPFGIATALTNQRLGHIHQLGVLQNKRMHINEGAHLSSRLGHLIAQLIQLGTHTLNSRFKTQDFFFHLACRQR